jgi:uncharacterized pyridoxamine 5'-phosphate oxidase family protein
MVDYISILEKNPNGVLATQDGKRVKTRVFQYLFADGNHIYFSTSNEKPVFAQLKDNPHVSFCTFPPDFSQVLTVEGKAVFAEDLDTKTRALESSPLIRDIYRTALNPVFKVFYVNVERVELYTMESGLRSFKIKQP